MVKTHRHHPHLARPISKAQFRSEFSRIWSRWDANEWTPAVVFEARMSRRHQKCNRDYAEVDTVRGVFVFAPETLLLPRQHRAGLIAHEVGHFINPGTEAMADRAAWECLGIQVAYDAHWVTRGNRRGLQYAKKVL